jgi:SAM-dependent methyltransferase
MADEKKRWKWIDRVSSWDVWKPPLRPSQEDVAFVEQKLSQIDNPLILLLGVTPEFARLERIEFRIQAVDISDAMIEKVWPGDSTLRKVYNADWFVLGERASNFDAVLGDGVLTVVWPPEDLSFLENVAAALKVGGKFITRVYLLPEKRKSINTIIENANSNISQFKLELLKHVAAENNGVAILSRVYNKFNEIRNRIPIGKLGWTKDDLTTVEIYKGSMETYTFFTRQKCMELFAAANFEVEETFVGTDPWSAECPTFVLRRVR